MMISISIDFAIAHMGTVIPRAKPVRPVIMVAKVIVGFTCPPEPGPAAMMRSVRSRTFESPTYAAPWAVSKFVIEVSTKPER